MSTSASWESVTGWTGTGHPTALSRGLVCMSFYRTCPNANRYGNPLWLNYSFEMLHGNFSQPMLTPISYRSERVKPIACLSRLILSLRFTTYVFILAAWRRFHPSEGNSGRCERVNKCEDCRDTTMKWSNERDFLYRSILMLNPVLLIRLYEPPRVVDCSP